MLLRNKQGPLCSKQDIQLVSDAIAAETDKDGGSEQVDLRGSMFLLGSGSAKCDRAPCQMIRVG
jgi:hypothetical protein